MLRNLSSSGTNTISWVSNGTLEVSVPKSLFRKKINGALFIWRHYRTHLQHANRKCQKWFMIGKKTSKWWLNHPNETYTQVKIGNHFSIFGLDISKIFGQVTTSVWHAQKKTRNMPSSLSGRNPPGLHHLHVDPKMFWIHQVGFLSPCCCLTKMRYLIDPILYTSCVAENVANLPNSAPSVAKCSVTAGGDTCCQGKSFVQSSP